MSRIGGWTAPRSRRWRAAAAARARVRSRRTTRTPRRWASQRRGRRCAGSGRGRARCGSRRRRRRISTRPTRRSCMPRCDSTAMSRTWEERFGETRYLPLAAEALKAALGAAGLGAEDVGALVLAGLHERACAAAAKKSGVAAERVIDRLTGSVGNPGAAQPLLLLASALETAGPGTVIVMLSLADGADAVVLRTTDAIAG